LANVPEAQKYVIKILKKVSNDYVYSGLDVDDEEDTKT
jgi:hypothetical protein